MLDILKSKLLVIVVALTMTVPVIVPIQAAAASPKCDTIGVDVNSGINAAVGSTEGCATHGSITTGVEALARKVINIFSIVVGVISVIMIIYAGLRYITSGGESGGVTGAKNTLLYAVIGLLIVILAQVIVRIVLSQGTSISNSVSGT
jgi:hypothetical protein